MFRFLGIASKCILGSMFILAVSASLHSARATSFKILYSFTGQADGGEPVFGSLVMDKNGNLYGTTGLINNFNWGTVYKLAPDGTETVLHSFSEGTDGFGPEALIMDNNGNLYGTACCGGNADGCGVVFEIPKNGNEKLVHIFEGADGCGPYDALIMDASGNFDGTAPDGGKHDGGKHDGGKHDGGIVFNLAPDGIETPIHSFNLKHGGHEPFAGLSVDATGNIYGTTGLGGGKDLGTVFEIAPDGTEKVLYSFKGPSRDGSYPEAGVVADQAGNLYGTLFSGGLAGCESDLGCGAVFKLSPDGTETVLHFFTGKKGDGGNPLANLIVDSSGNLYGTTEYGGGSGCNLTVYGCGTVFKVTPDGTETVLHSFKTGSNGGNPIAGLLADAAGDLYGTTEFGGQYGYGTVFEITP